MFLEVKLGQLTCMLLMKSQGEALSTAQGKPDTRTQPNDCQVQGLSTDQVQWDSQGSADD